MNIALNLLSIIMFHGNFSVRQVCISIIKLTEKIVMVSLLWKKSWVLGEKYERSSTITPYLPEADLPDINLQTNLNSYDIVA